VANTIREPRQGTTTKSRRIAQAVDDQEWQEFRVSLKGKSTSDKLKMLKGYYEEEFVHTHVEESFVGGTLVSGRDDCDVCIRIDNYLKALARGGQLVGGVNLIDVIALDWKPTIKR
jgi:hypothetical protein